MVVGAAGCSLIAMVARICVASKKYEAVHDLARRLIGRADALRARLLELREADEAAFEAVVAARGDKEALQRALAGAAIPPLTGAHAALEALRLSSEALELRNANLVSDAACAAEFAYAALVACAYNVRINHKFMKDEAAIQAQSAQLQECERGGARVLHDVREAVNGALAR